MEDTRNNAATTAAEESESEASVQKLLAAFNSLLLDPAVPDDLKLHLFEGFQQSFTLSTSE